MKVRANPDVIARIVGERTILIDSAIGRCFGLDAVGGRMWRLLVEYESTEPALDQLVAEFDADASVIARDLKKLVDALSRHNLIAVTSKSGRRRK